MRTDPDSVFARESLRVGWRHDETRGQSLAGAVADERGAAIIMALLVALILVFLGMGLLLQTSLGLQASGTDRWVTKALYAADAGCMMQIQMIQMGVVGELNPGTTGQPGNFILEDDPSQQGLLKGKFTVEISDFCETRPVTPVFVDGVPSGWPDFQTRHFHLRSDASRDLGNLTGLTRSAVEVDISAYPFMKDMFVIVPQCS